MNIELRWVVRSTPIGGEQRWAERVLQYRLLSGPFYKKEVDGSTEFSSGVWGPWTDVPVEADK